MVGNSEDPQLQAPVKHALTGTPQTLPLIPVLVLIMLPIVMCPLLFPGDSLALSTATLTWDPNMETDLAGYNVYVGTSPGIYGAPITVGNVTLYTISGLLEGVTYFFAVTAYDTSGNESIPSKEISKTIPLPSDTTPPTVSLTAPTPGATVTGTVTLQASATDNVSVSGVQFMINAANLGAEVLTVPYTTAWNTGSLSPGTYTLTAVARDAAGNHTTSAPVIVQVAAPPSGTGFLQDAGPDGLLVLEAEHFHANTPQGGHAWTLVTPQGHSGEGALKATPNKGKNRKSNYLTRSPRLDFTVWFATTGTHYVWIRGMASSKNDNSVHIGLDGNKNLPSQNMVGFGNTGKWKWSTKRGKTVASIEIATPGAHTINVWMREDGFIVDKLVLTTNATYTPSGIGPAESLQAK